MKRKRAFWKKTLSMVPIFTAALTGSAWAVDKSVTIFEPFMTVPENYEDEDGFQIEAPAPIETQSASTSQQAKTKTQGGTQSAPPSPKSHIALSLGVSEKYNDNIYTVDTGETDDFITSISPEIKVSLADSPHLFDITAGATQEIYADHSDDNVFNYNAGAKGRYKFDKDLTWSGSASYKKLHSARGDDQDNPNADASEPLPYSVVSADTSVEKIWDKWAVQPRVKLTDYDYENVRRINGAMIDKSDRNRIEYEMGGRVGYRLEGGYEPFADLTLNPRLYDKGSVTDRDSQGGSALLGLRYKPDKTLSLELAGGYMGRNYDVRTYDDIQTFDSLARVNWTYTENGKFTASLNRSIGEVTDTNTGGSIRTNVKAGITQGLAQDLTGKLEGKYANSAFDGGNGATNGRSDREDHLYGSTIGLAYALTPEVSLTTDYTYDKNESNKNSADYDKNTVILGLKGGF